MNSTKDNARRGLILRHAAALFRRRGYDRSSVREIAEAAGMTSGSLFYYFASKEDLLVEVMLDGLRAITASVAEAWGQDEPLRDRLRDMLRCHLTGLLGSTLDAMTVLLYESRSLSEQAQQRVLAERDAYERLWGQAIDAAAAQGLVDADTVLLRQTVLGALNWTTQWYRPSGRLGVAALAECMFRLLFPRLAASACASPILETMEIK